MAKSITRNGKTYRLGYSVKILDGEIIPDNESEITESDVDEYENAEKKEAELQAELQAQEAAI